ncbi:hypothetical protein MBH78_08390 [Oceanimonas sp. NS1]|nr:hypothetical protein [Oceanimonas sp. NS1]
MIMDASWLIPDRRRSAAGKSMLTAGLGELLLIPPNHGYWHCLLQAESIAYGRRLGIWSQNLPRVPARTGWQRLWFQVHEVHQGRGGVTIRAAGGLKVRTGKRLSAQSRRALGRLQAGEHLFVRGHARKTADGWLLSINHPWQFHRENSGIRLGKVKKLISITLYKHCDKLVHSVIE